MEIQRLSLQGHPSIDTDWTGKTLKYTDAEGQEQTLKTPLTPADFAPVVALVEERRKNWRMLKSLAGV